jgi:hypothetical protein
MKITKDTKITLVRSREKQSTGYDKNDPEKYSWMEAEIWQMMRVFFPRIIEGIETEVVWPENLTGRETLRIWDVTHRETELALWRNGLHLDDFDNDEFVIIYEPKDIFIIGKTYKATMWGVYEFFYREVGAVWTGGMSNSFWLGDRDRKNDTWTYLPKKTSVVIPKRKIFRSGKPWFAMRDMIRFCPQAHRHDRSWVRAHNLWIYADPRKYGTGDWVNNEMHIEERPEYFPIINGEVHMPTRHYSSQARLAEPAFINHVVSEVIKHFERHPGSECVTVGQNDNHNWCEWSLDHCDMPPEITEKRHRITYTWIWFMNTIAQKLREAGWGHKKITSLGTYATGADAGLFVHPLTPDWDEMVITGDCMGDAAQLYDPGEVSERQGRIDYWKDHGNASGNKWASEYLYGSNFIVPRWYVGKMFELIDSRYEVGANGFYAETYPVYSIDGPKLYLIAKRLWEGPSGKTFNEELEAVCKKLYATAWKKMKAYWLHVENCWNTQPLCEPGETRRTNYRWHSNARQLDIFTTDSVAEAHKLLTDSVKRVNRLRNSDRKTQALERLNQHEKTFSLVHDLVNYRNGADIPEADIQAKHAEAFPYLEGISWSTIQNTYLKRKE